MMSKFLNSLSILILTLIAVVFYSNTIDAAAGHTVTVSSVVNGVTKEVVSTQAAPGTFYYNKSSNLNVSFSLGAAGNAPYTITINSGSSPSFSVQEPSAGSVNLTPVQLSGLTTGTYPLIVTSSNGIVSATTNIVIDNTIPDFDNNTLIIRNSEDVPILDIRSNSSVIKLVAPTLVETNFANEYIVNYGFGVTAVYDRTLLPAQYTVTPNAGGDIITFNILNNNFQNGTVHFRVRAVDRAGNISTDAPVASFIYDTVIPGPVTNIVMRDGTEIVAPGSSRKAVTQMTWTAPASTTDISYYNVWARVGSANFAVISSGSTTTAAVDTSSFANGTVQFKIQPVDQAGNAIPEENLTPISFILNKRNISFDIQYFPSVTSGYLTVSGVAAINSIQRESLLVVDAEPLIASYAISVADLDNDSYTFKTGTKADLQTELRALEGSPAGGYYVIVRDVAANSYRIKLNLQQVGPTLPVDKSLRIASTSTDTKDIIGISAVIRIQFDTATGADFYKAYVNGEETAIINSGVGFVDVKLDTIIFGPVDNTYELRAFTNEGNFDEYTRRSLVTQDLVKPYAVINSTQSRDTSIAFNLTVTDSNNLLTSSNAVLYLNGVEVQRQVVTKGTNDYLFNNLSVGRSNYQIKILGAFGFNNVNFPATTIINEGNVYSRSTVYNLETLRTSPDVFVNIDSYSHSFNAITVSITSTKRSIGTFDYELKIYDANDALVSSASTQTVENATSSLTQTDTKTITGLVVGGKYQLRVFDGNSVIATINFFTTKEVPTATVTTSAVRRDALDLIVRITDPDGAISTSPRKGLLKIYDADNLALVHTMNIDTANSNVVLTIPNLSSDKQYIARIFANYVTDDVYIVSNNLLVQETFRTAKPAPTATVTWFGFDAVTSNSITFEVNVEDPFNTLRETLVQLYRLDQKIGEPIAINRGRFSNLVFSGLQSNTEYVIIIQAKYDLNDGKGVITKDGFLQGFPTTFYRSNTFKTTKTTPTVSVLSSGVSNVSATIQLQILDVDTTFSSATVKLFKPGVAAPVSTRVASLRAETFRFDQLEPNIAYTFVVEADYNLGDGRGIQSRKAIYEEILRTDANVSAVISPAITEPTSIRLGINVRDYMNQIVVARLFQGNNVVGQPVLLNNGTNSLIFENLSVETIYRVAVEYTSGSVIQLAEQTFQTNRALALAIPSITLSPLVLNQTSIQVSAIVTDVDSVLGDVISVNVCGTLDNICTTVQRSVSELQVGITIDVEPGSYSVLLTAPYNTLTATGIAESLVQTFTLEEADPIDPVVVPEVPRDPSETNIGLVIISLLGVSVIGSVGVFIYSFRKMYIR
jgi:hypothetical protein